jgi:hypothetical protein
MTFDEKNKTIHFSTYSPTLDKYAGLNGENTFNQPPQFSDFTLAMPVQVLNASQFKAKTGEQWDLSYPDDGDGNYGSCSCPDSLYRSRESAGHAEESGENK